MKKFKNLFLVIFSLLILSGIFSWDKLSVPDLYAAPSLFQVVENWAPVIKQGTEGNFDFITKFDYDGNWNGYDNWNNFGGNTGRLHAYVYYAIIESAGHYFITYMIFHPKDVGNPFAGFASSHENDSEGCRVVIKKDGSTYGKLEFLETIAHHDKIRYELADLPYFNSHPTIYITPYKHAIYGTNYAEQSFDRLYLEGGRVFPSKDGGGVVYSYGDYAELPRSHTGINYCSYDLIDMEPTIWARRFDVNSYCCATYGRNDLFISNTYQQYCGYDPTVNHYHCTCFPIDPPTFASRFGGDDYSTDLWWLDPAIVAGRNAAPAPWRYDHDMMNAYFIDNHWYFGYWFINPLGYYYGLKADCTGVNEGPYVYNPYWDSLSELPPDPEPPPEPPPERPPKPPKDPIPMSYDLSASELDPSISYLESPLFATEEVVWYWDSKHSFIKNEHSLANWLEGKTIGAGIDSNGNLEIEVSYSNFPNVVTSPDLNFLEEGFDEVRITYLNLMEYPPGKKPKGGIGWVDEAMIETMEQEISEGSDEGYFTIFPLKFQGWQAETVKMKGLKYWKENVRVRGLLITPAYGSITTQGKFLISSIELIKIEK